MVLTSWPRPSTATHMPGARQEIPFSWLWSTFASFHARAPPVAAVEESTLPASSTATHSFADAHEIPHGMLFAWVSTDAGVQIGAGPAGLVEVSTLPVSSVATHSDVDG